MKAADFMSKAESSLGAARVLLDNGYAALRVVDGTTEGGQSGTLARVVDGRVNW